MAKIYSNLGRLNATAGEYRWALDYFTKALTIYKEHKDDFQISTNTNNIGWVHGKLGKYEEAFQCFEKSY